MRLCPASTWLRRGLLGSSLSFTLSVLALGPTGCQATPADITTWKGTQKGPQKLRDVVKDEKATPQLRALATAALIEIGMGADAAQDLAALDVGTRAKIARELVVPLGALLGDSVNQPGPTTPVQNAAKDALFLARKDAEQSDKQRIDAILLKWVTQGLAARASLGGQSTENIVTTIGPSASAALVPFVKPGPDLMIAAQLLGATGDRDAQTRAVQPLIASVRSGGISEPVLQAIGLIGGADATAVLIDVASRPSAPIEIRKKALYALAQGHMSSGDSKALAGALTICRDAKAPGDVREAGFQVTEKMGPAAVGGIVTLFADKDSIVRWRSVEAALKAGGASGIGPVLAALPEDRPVKSEDLDSFVVHDLGLVGKEGLPAVTTAAKGEGVHGLGQVAAIRSLGRQGTAASVPVLTALFASTVAVKTLVPQARIADEAHHAVDAIGKRK